MFKGPQGMSLADNAATAASAAVATTSAATAAADKKGPRTDKFMKIDINHPQYT